MIWPVASTTSAAQPFVIWGPAPTIASAATPAINRRMSSLSCRSISLSIGLPIGRDAQPVFLTIVLQNGLACIGKQITHPHAHRLGHLRASFADGVSLCLIWFAAMITVEFFLTARGGKDASSPCGPPAP